MVTGSTQTNQKLEPDDHAGNTVTSVCVTNEKDMALQQQIRSTFVTVMRFSRTRITDGTVILILERYPNLQTILVSFFKNSLEKQ